MENQALAFVGKYLHGIVGIAAGLAIRHYWGPAWAYVSGQGTDVAVVKALAVLKSKAVAHGATQEEINNIEAHVETMLNRVSQDVAQDMNKK